MTIEKYLDGTELTVKLIGRLTTSTVSRFESVLKESLSDIQTLILDFAELEYMSSSGLRVLLKTQRTINKQGKMVIRNMNQVISEIFAVTGFENIFTVE